jgi:anthranilate synthase component 1
MRDRTSRPSSLAPSRFCTRQLVAENAVELDEGLPPMSAGLFGYLGYDMVRHMERLGPPKPGGLRRIPDALLIRPTTTLIFDHVRDEMFIIRLVNPEPEGDAHHAFAEAAGAIDSALEALAEPLPAYEPRSLGQVSPIEPRSNVTAARYADVIGAAKEHIAAGDIFQVVLSQRFETPFPLPAFELYRSLRRTNPAPFLCYLDFEDFQLVCSSPEILVRLRDGTVTVRPIAGTRPRGTNVAEDERLADELLNDPKERAEHLMLLDLGRNDVGRVAELGSVQVTESFAIERYSQVMHIVSNVEGRLRSDCDALDALVAGFPAGTVSGAPKIRAMEVIDDLEPEGRGPYGGCIGYFGPNGQMDTCIVLRTGLVKDGRLSVQAGAGIVYDSDRRPS